MKTIDAILAGLKEKAPLGYWGDRVVSQLEYANQLSRIKEGRYDELISSALSLITGAYSEEGAITKDSVLKAESIISVLSEEAKKFTMICAAHAHIDMNWMWRWDETVAVTIDTFRTMLDLMKEYPAFKFSQSQASVYKIIEDYAPEMLEEIRKRVKEGRWEVTASTWVENDKNMPNGESLSRHILYTKRYLSKLLDIAPESLNMDFEPDTFGHNINVPEVLADGGVKYYYHCRGYEGHNLYRWVSPSGKSVTVYREPLWYNSAIEPSMAVYIPGFCTKYGMDTMLKVYGVGDHGGGPTRRDIERIIDFNTWPVFPEIRFGTFGEYFGLAENVAANLPIVEEELNFVFTGCYTSQSRIKTANRKAEAALNEAEVYNTISALNGGYMYSSQAFAGAWRNVLFNQFHDIIPGSGVIDTREYAMGLFQNAMAAVNTRKNLALRSIAASIDTAGLAVVEDDKDTVSEGAGVGFGVDRFKMTQCERGSGKTRVFHFFNSSALEREEPVEITVWDWKWDLNRLIFRDEKGNSVEHQLLDHGFNSYWGHEYLMVLVKVKISSFGYSTYVMTESDDYTAVLEFPKDPRVEKIGEYVLENDIVKVVFNSRDASIISFIDKATGEDIIDKNKPAGIFRYIEEEGMKWGTAWIVGRYASVRELNGNVRFLKSLDSGALRNSISYEIEFESSKMKVTVSLDDKSAGLVYDVECDWHEIGKKEVFTPQLSFHMPVGYNCSTYKYDIPFGVIEREGMDRDVPANSWVAGMRSETGKKLVMLITDSKYGFRSLDNSMSITLLRSSVDPDPYPEFGIHRFSFSVNLVENASNKDLIEYAYRFNHPVSFLSSKVQNGTQPPVGSFLNLDSNAVVVSAVKMPEDEAGGKKAIIRVYEANGANAKAVLHFTANVKAAYFVDLNENRIDPGAGISIEKESVQFEVSRYSTTSICVEFA